MSFDKSLFGKLDENESNGTNVLMDNNGNGNGWVMMIVTVRPYQRL